MSGKKRYKNVADMEARINGREHIKGDSYHSELLGSLEKGKDNHAEKGQLSIVDAA